MGVITHVQYICTCVCCTVKRTLLCIFCFAWVVLQRVGCMCVLYSRAHPDVYIFVLLGKLYRSLCSKPVLRVG